MDFMGWAILTPIGNVGKNFSFFRITFYSFDVFKKRTAPSKSVNFLMYITHKTNFFRKKFHFLTKFSDQFDQKILGKNVKNFKLEN